MRRVRDLRREGYERKKKYGVPGFAGMHEMMRVTKPDVVSVLTESSDLARHAIDLAQ